MSGKLLKTFVALLAIAAAATGPARAQSTEVWQQTALADITASDVFVIVCQTVSDGCYAMQNSTSGSAGPSAVGVTVTGNALASAPADNLKWHLSVNNGVYTFYPGTSGTGSWLYCESSNNGVRVGTGANGTFTVNNGYLYNDGTNRYVGVYTGAPNWRCYTSINNNISGQEFYYYVLTSTTPVPRTLTGIPSGWQVTADGSAVTVNGDTATIATGATVVLTPSAADKPLVKSVTLTP